MTLVEWVAAAVIVGGLVFLRRRIVALGRGAAAWVRQRPLLPLALPIVFLVVGASLLAWKVPQRQLADVRPADLQPLTSTKDYLELVNAYRATIVQLFGGLLVLIGSYTTLRRMAMAERQVVIAGEAQITERFTRAIDQLGSEQLEVKLGGIYALERIARASERDHWPIMEVLTAYVRQHAPAPEEE
jgi:hypothetical protein